MSLNQYYIIYLLISGSFGVCYIRCLLLSVPVTFGVCYFRSPTTLITYMTVSGVNVGLVSTTLSGGFIGINLYIE